MELTEDLRCKLSNMRSGDILYTDPVIIKSGGNCVDCPFFNARDPGKMTDHCLWLIRYKQLYPESPSAAGYARWLRVLHRYIPCHNNYTEAFKTADTIIGGD